MEEGLVELNRCRSDAAVADTTEPLAAAGIPYKLGSTAIIFDFTKIGTGDDPEVIVSVREEDYAAARAVLEEEYGKVDLPEGHYLLDASDEDLADILARPSEWNPYDVAHARKLANERDLNPEKVAKKKEERLAELEKGKPASKRVLFFGWMFSVLGLFAGMFGIAGIGVAWSLCFMKEKAPDGSYYTYNAKTRELGSYMFALALLSLAVWIFFIFSR